MDAWMLTAARSDITIRRLRNHSIFVREQGLLMNVAVMLACLMDKTRRFSLMKIQYVRALMYADFLDSVKQLH